MNCHILDDECNEEYRQLMNKYYAAGLVTVVLLLIFMAGVIIQAKVTRKDRKTVSERRESIIKKAIQNQEDTKD